MYLKSLQYFGQSLISVIIFLTVNEQYPNIQLSNPNMFTGGLSPTDYNFLPSKCA